MISVVVVTWKRRRHRLAATLPLTVNALSAARAINGGGKWKIVNPISEKQMVNGDKWRRQKCFFAAAWRGVNRRDDGAAIVMAAAAGFA